MDSNLKSMIPLTYNWAVKTIVKAGDYLDLQANIQYVEKKVFRSKIVNLTAN